MILWISVAFPLTINSILPKVWKAISLVKVDQVLVLVLSNDDPERAPKYSSQVSWILESASVLVDIPLM